MMTPVQPSLLTPALPRQPRPVNRLPSVLDSMPGLISLLPGGPLTCSTSPLPVPIRWANMARKEGAPLNWRPSAVADAGNGPSGPSAVADAEEGTHAWTGREATGDNARGLGQPPGDLKPAARCDRLCLMLPQRRAA